MDTLPASWKIRPPQVRVAYHEVQTIEDVKMRIVILECGHTIVRAPEWFLHETYPCNECCALSLKENGGRI